ncbi:hypothetical protein RHGRI_008115 [Rhododendron griersonianum]|uniref:Uncharacterized protein n=1 Tax=Rhododendron griersonianum TaxID=479676 RepID=A0AAV6L0M8_9ERIC|nr:hypothetical protein RHGRI_008115 [Rhododendron griersonianum]
MVVTTLYKTMTKSSKPMISAQSTDLCVCVCVLCVSTPRHNSSCPPLFLAWIILPNFPIVFFQSTFSRSGMGVLWACMSFRIGK